MTILVEKLIFLFNFKLCDKCSYILGLTYCVIGTYLCLMTIVNYKSRSILYITSKTTYLFLTDVMLHIL